jgi:hypothetical protein
MKKNDLMFLKYVLVFSFIVVLISFYPVYIYASKIQIYSFITGYLISFINVLIGHILNKSALNKSVKSFMAIVFGSMALRLILVAIFMVILLTYTKLDSVSLVTSVFFFYFLFVSLEIYFISKKSNKSAKVDNSPATLHNGQA